METNFGLCQCGCGQITKRWKSKGGKPARFILGHNHRGKIGPKNGNWKGGSYINQGYRLKRMPSHPRQTGSGYVREHILICEKALGKPLPAGTIPHHHNGQKADNRRGNLVLCQDSAYHQILHLRAKALKSCGHVHWRKCCFCHKYDDPENMKLNEGTRSCHHRRCHAEYHRSLRKAKREKEYLLIGLRKE